jgi:transposase
MDGQVTGKSFNAYQVNEGLLANVVEAIKKGEADARRYSQLKSFQIYYNGYRERLVLGKIIIVPAKLADSPEDFPSALLYGAMMKEMTPEDQADLYSFKLGESEYDEYDSASMKAIKERLFTDADGVLRSVIIFIPTWANVRDFIHFKMTRDWELLTRMVRHQIFGAYFDPRFSSAFDFLAQDTDNLHVSDITPKIDFPGLAGGIKNFPDLEACAEDERKEPAFPELKPGDGLSKRASGNKPIVLLASDTLEAVEESFLEPGEKAVIDNLADELRGKINGEIEEPLEVGGKPESIKTAKPKEEDYQKKVLNPDVRGNAIEVYRCSDCGAKYPNPAMLKSHADVCPGPKVAGKTAKYEQKIWSEGDIYRYELVETGFMGGKKTITYGFAPDEKQAQAHIDRKLDELGVRTGGDEPLSVYAKIVDGKRVDDSGAETGLRRQPDYGERDSHTVEANELASKGASAKAAAGMPSAICPECGNDVRGYKGENDSEAKRDFRFCSHDVDGKECSGTNKPFSVHKSTRTGALSSQQETRYRMLRDKYDRQGQSALTDDELREMAHLAVQYHDSRTASLSIEGATLTINNGGFYAKAASGHVERLRINGKTIKWVRPLQFSNAFRQASETFIRNPRNSVKVADVPQTFDEIWSDIAEEMGPAPSVSLKDVPKTDGSHDSVEKSSVGEGREQTKPSSEVAEGGEAETEPKKPWEKKEASRIKTASASIGKCAACHRGVLASNGSEVAPDHFLHAACQERAKRAAFDMFIPSQVAKEFYPEVLQETVDFPGGEVGDKDGHDPAIGLPGESPTGVYQAADGIPGNGDAYIPTGPSQAMGIGNDGQQQILEGAPLRQDNDIRGYSFDQEYYAQQSNLDPKAFVASYVVEKINKKASPEEFQAQFADFLKRAMGEIAAAFIAGFKVTSRPPMNKVPGTGEVALDQVEQSSTPLPYGATNVGSRVRYLLSKLTDSQIQSAINDSWAQAAVYNEDKNGGYTFEIFVRPDSIDKTTTVLRYQFVVGTKGL